MCRWVLGAVLVLAFVRGASADERWTSPYRGVKHVHIRANHLDAHAVVVDLGAASTSVVVTRPADRGITVREFAQRYNADIAINANYFDVGLRPCGLSAGDGVIWPDAYRESCRMSMGFGDLNEAVAFDSEAVLRGPLPEDWMKHVVSGKPWLLRRGVIQGGWYDPPHIHRPHPRTAIGLSRDRNTLFILVADGRRPGLPGIDGEALAVLLADLGAYDALNLDGGGSSALFINSEGGIQNRPSNPLLRGVGNHLGVRINASAKWYGAELEGISKTPMLRPGDVAKLWVRYRNTGRFSWQPRGKHAITLASTSQEPNPFYLPGWVSVTAPVGLDHVVRSGETATFDFPIGAPAMMGNFLLEVSPMLSGMEPIAAVPTGWQVTVEDAQAGLIEEVVAVEESDTDAPERSMLASMTGGIESLLWHAKSWIARMPSLW